MADESNKLIQEIVLEGADKVASQFEQIGTSAEAGLAKVSKGANAASSSLAGVGASGEKAFGLVAVAGEAAATKSGAIAAAAKRVGISYDEMATRIANSGSTIRSFGATATQAVAAPAQAVGRFSRALDFFGATLKESKRDAQGMSQSAADAAAGIRGLNDSGDQAAGGIGKLDTFAIRTGSSLRLLGRAAQIRELSQLGRAIGVLGRAFALGAPLLFVAGLEKLASSAAAAAVTVADLATKGKLTLDSFQTVSAAFSGIGKGAEDAGQATSGLAGVLKETDHNTRENAKNFRQLGEAIVTAREKLAEVSQGFIELNHTSSKEQRDFSRHMEDMSKASKKSLQAISDSIADIDRDLADLDRGPLSEAEQKERRRADLKKQRSKLSDQALEETLKAQKDAAIAVENHNEALRKQNEELRKLEKQERAEEKAVRDSERAMREAREEAERSATVLQKLGITALDANGKLKQTPEVLADIADKLKGLEDSDDTFKILAVEAGLVAAGIDTQMLPALRKGAQGFKDLVAEGKRINPGFTPDQVHLADNFQIAIGQVSQAFTGLKNAIGLAVAPAFIPLFQKFRDTVISIREPVTSFFTALGKAISDARPAIEQFSSIISSNLAAAIKLIRVLIVEILIPAFKGIQTAAEAFAKFLNENLPASFGASITGTDVLIVAIGGLALILGGLPLQLAAVALAFGLLVDKFNDNKALAIGLAVAIGILIIAFASWPVILASLVIALGFVITKWNDVKAVMNAVVEGAQKKWQSFVTFLTEAWDGAIAWIKDKLTKFATWFEETWAGKLISAIRKALSWLGQLVAAQQEVKDMSGGIPGVGGDGTPMARGGIVRGPGTPTSDSILTRLSRNEFVVRAAAVRRPGVLPWLHAINSMRTRVPQFNMGGLVGALTHSLIPAMAGGGEVSVASGGSTGRPVVLNIGGESFNLITRDSDTAEQLGRFAVKRRLTSTGRKPSHWGG